MEITSSSNAQSSPIAEAFFRPLSYEHREIFAAATKFINGFEIIPVSVFENEKTPEHLQFLCKVSFPSSPIIWEWVFGIRTQEEQHRLDEHHYPLIQLANQLLINPQLLHSIEEALQKAKFYAKQHISKQVYTSIDEHLNKNGWPETIGQFFLYLNEISKSSSLQITLTDNEQHTEQYINLGLHFYWLLQQEITVDQNTQYLYNHRNHINGFNFKHWAEQFMYSWGTYLQSPSSLTQLRNEINTFFNESMYLKGSMATHWHCYQDYLDLSLPDSDPKSGISTYRSIDTPNTNDSVSAPSDCYFNQEQVIDKNGQFHSILIAPHYKTQSIHQLLGNTPYNHYFYNGKIVHYSIPQNNYASIHAPVIGTLLHTAFSIGTENQLVQYRKGQFTITETEDYGGFSYASSKGVLIFDTKDIGKVALIAIGDSVKNGVALATELQGRAVCKGYQLGSFKSNHGQLLLLFENPDIAIFQHKNSINSQYEYGNSIGKYR